MQKLDLNLYQGAYQSKKVNWYYPLKSEENQWRETGDTKKPSVITLSMELYYKSSLAADSTRNIIMLLSFKCIHSYIR